jgi:hypothetical protein
VLLKNLRRPSAAASRLLFALATGVAGLPAHNAVAAGGELLVELRVVRESDVAADGASDSNAAVAVAPATVLSTRSLADELPPPQMLRLANGGRGVLRNVRRMPVFWLQAAAVQGQAQAGRGQTGALLNQRLIWLEAGQTLAVQASWPGGRAPVKVDLALDTRALDTTRAQQGVPATQSRSVSTQLVTPMGRWTTFAAIGAAGAGTSGRGGAGKAAATVLSTRDLSDAAERQLWQLRVMAD